MNGVSVRVHVGVVAEIGDARNCSTFPREAELCALSREGLKQEAAFRGAQTSPLV